MSHPSVVHDNVLSLIGHTPLIRLDKIAAEEGLKCNLYAKVELFNAGGSVKDRIALRMVEQAEKEGRLIPGKSVLVEPSSGNTGVGLALVAAVKGYRCIITMPEKMSIEKENTMVALGAELIRTPTEAAHDSPDSNIGKAKQLLKEIPNAVMLNQYDNENNPDAHYHGTAPEIIEALASISTSTTSAGGARSSTGKCDLMVAGAGTGGTLTGLSKRLHESNPDVVVLGVDPRGSILARPEGLNKLATGESDQYKIEGIGYDFVPGVLEHSTVTRWIKSNDAESFAAARRIIRTEGILCGGSSGSALSGALAFLKSGEGKREFANVEGKNVVILLADGIRNYISSPWLGTDSKAK
ncbi:BQ2448_5317 [Microbotryum intermedium]|uniref:cystathionine beta-synthase n=1 Tax=Microbotryum intermedium TaxID=269621 RepID=A0A238F9F6_9BASI|nr:BQ2448_5317 [Microbotryum intermedium]